MKILGHVDQLHAGLDYHLARHNVLASNLANVDTPEYKARDLERIDSFDKVLATAMTKSDPRHMGAGNGGIATKVTVDEATPPDADGNSVSLDREVVKISSNHLRYETVSTLASAELASLAWAAQDGRGA
ncbi:MAG: flagellar basal body rod protein FlgB [Polyangiaceae bacterium]|nr:flagellar basal body rod protein FlgB [Polyangiaceae bacterium]